jgi:regulator of sigma E protease
VITAEPLKAVFVEKGSPADKVGLQKEDVIVSLANQKLSSSEQLAGLTKRHKGQTVSFAYNHKKKLVKTTVSLRQKPDKNQGILGVSSASKTNYRSTWSAPIVGVGATVQFSSLTVKGLGDLVVNLGKGISAQLSGNQTTREKGGQALAEVGASVAGPIGILGVIFPAAQEAGLVPLLLLVGIISLTLAIMNALPIPALDGGRLFVTLLYRVTKTPLTKEKEEKIHGTGFVFLIALIVIISIADAFKIF